MSAEAMERPLESVDDYRARKCREARERELRAKRTGVACPKCGVEMLWRSAALLLMGALERGEAVCGPCGISVYLPR